MMSEERVHISDVRASGYCVKGIRTWFDKHGLDFKHFLKNGIAATELIEKGDGLAKKVVAEKRARDGR